MQEEKTAENKANYIDGGNFKARIGNTTYLVGVFFNKAKKVTIEDRMKQGTHNPLEYLIDIF